MQTQIASISAPSVEAQQAVAASNALPLNASEPANEPKIAPTRVRKVGFYCGETGSVW